jgi:hypothetical protein
MMAIDRPLAHHDASVKVISAMPTASVDCDVASSSHGSSSGSVCAGLQAAIELPDGHRTGLTAASPPDVCTNGRTWI